MTDLHARIDGLTDDDAVAALAAVLHEDDATLQRRKELEQVADLLPEALPQTEAVDSAAVEEAVATGDVPTRGEMARVTLAFLADEGDMADEIARTLDSPRAIAHQDILTFAIGGLVVVALTRVRIKLQRDKQGRWAFDFELKPASAGTAGALLTKLFTHTMGG